MPWSERLADGSSGAKTSAEYDLLKENLLPVATKEASQDKNVKPLEFQPVKSPGNYEAEFTRKDEDVLFHFWPWGFHDAQDKGETLPRFKQGFETFLVQSMAEVFNARTIQIEHDPDMGALFIRCRGAGLNQFFRENAIKACESLHAKYES